MCKETLRKAPEARRHHHHTNIFVLHTRKVSLVSPSLSQTHKCGPQCVAYFSLYISFTLCDHSFPDLYSPCCHSFHASCVQLIQQLVPLPGSGEDLLFSVTCTTKPTQSGPHTQGKSCFKSTNFDKWLQMHQLRSYGLCA